MKRHLISTARRPAALGANPHWYKDAIIYEARVRSFYDSNSDGYCYSHAQAYANAADSADAKASSDSAAPTVRQGD